MKFFDENCPIRKNIYELIIHYIPYEDSERNKYSKILHYLFYALDYITIILAFIVGKTSYQHPYHDEKAIYFYIASTILALLYIHIQALGLMVLKKIIWIVHIFLFSGISDEFFYFLPFSILSWSVWALKIQKRKVHFDSRLYCGYPLLKLISLEIFLGALKYGRQESHAIYFLFLILCCAYLDYNDTIYQSNVWGAFILMDLCLFSIFLVDYLNHSHLNDSFDLNQLMMLLVINFLCSVGVLLLWENDDFSELYEIDPFIQNPSNSVLLSYFMKLDELCDCKITYQTNKYLYFHLAECTHEHCFLRIFFQQRKQLTITINESLRRFFFESLRFFAKKNETIREYLLYRCCEKSELTLKFLKKQNFFELREFIRLFSDISSQNKENPLSKNTVILDLDALAGNDFVNRINVYMSYSIEFWKQLLENNVNMGKLYNCSTTKFDMLNGLRNCLSKKPILSDRKRFLINEFMRYICLEENNVLQSKLKIVQKYFSKFNEAIPAFLVSAQNRDLLQIIDVNTAAVKCSGYFKEQLIGLTIDNLWGEDLREDHINFTRKRSKQSVFDSGRVCEALAFITNKFGYIVLANGFVHHINDIDGKKWCVALDPYLQGQPIFAINFNRKLVGLSEASVSNGMNKQMIGLKINDGIFEQAITKKSGLKLKGKNLFEKPINGFDSSSRQKITIKFISELNFRGKSYYYVFSISRKVEDNRVTRRSSLMTSQISSLTNRSIHKFSEQNKSPLVDFQFNYDFERGCFTNTKNRLSQNIIYETKEKQKEMEESIKETKNEYFEGDEIIQMRIFDGKIDFIENMPRAHIKGLDLNQYQAIPWAEEFSSYKEITEGKYKEIKESRKNKTPLSLNILRVFFVFFVLISVVFLIILAVEKSTKDSERERQRTLLIDLETQFLDYIFLGTRTITKFYEPSKNLTQEVMEKISQIEAINREISSVETSFPQKMKIMYNGETLDQILNDYRLIVNDFINDPDYQEEHTLQHALSKVYPGQVLLQKSTYLELVENSLNMNKKFLIIIGVSGFFVILTIFLFKKIINHLKKQLKDLCLIYKDIPETFVEIYIKKLESFKNYVELGKTVLDEEILNFEEPQNAHRSLYMKKIVNQVSFKVPIFLFALMLLFYSSFLFLEAQIQIRKVEIHQNSLNLIESSYNVSIHGEMIWLLLNKFPYDVPLLDHYENIMYEADKNLQLTMNQGLQKFYYSETFINFLKVFAFNDSCTFFKVDNCQNQINGALKMGTKQMYAFMFRKYDFLMHSEFPAEQFRSIQVSKNLYHLQRYYLEKGCQIFSDAIVEGIKSDEKLILIPDNFSKVFFSLGLLLSLCCFWVLRQMVIKIEQMEYFLTFLPFKFIQNNHGYWMRILKDYKK